MRGQITYSVCTITYCCTVRSPASGADLSARPTYRMQPDQREVQEWVSVCPKLVMNRTTLPC
jgi:hypothetical protein